MGRRLIDADKLKAHYSWWKGGSREMTMDEAKSDFDTIIDLQPTVDPTKHGQWIKRGDNSWECSVCHEISCCNGNYCVDCGAKMDLDEVAE